jgi:pilus assembly protein CpaB
VARRPLAAGRRIRAADLAVRHIPARYALAGSGEDPSLLVGHRLAAPVPPGGAVTLEHVSATGARSPLRPGQRAADVIAAGEPAALTPGARVDVLVTRDRGETASGGAELALQDVEVLAARPAPPDAGHGDAGGPLVQATLRVGVRQAVFLAAAQSFAREIRLLARAPGDRGRVAAAPVGPDLR